MRIAVAMVLVLSCASLALAGFNVNVTRPKNTLSSPEKAAGEVAERVFEEVFRP